MYKLISLDIDDTLLDSKKQLSKANHDAIFKAREAGVTITIATGRTYRASRKYMEMLEVDGSVINYGGSQVTRFPSDEVLYIEEVPLPLVREVIDFAGEVGEFIQCYEGDDFYFNKPTKYSDDYGKVMGYSGITTDLNTHPFKRVPKLLIIADPQRIQELLPVARERFAGRLNVTMSKPFFMEFNSPLASKGHALKALAESLGISREEVIAMGDSLIDNEMIQYAGLGVCVANGQDETKAVADYISPSCDEDAVAHVINKFVLY